MKSNQRNPIWPYLLVLACLFLLSVAAPRGWERTFQNDRHDSQTFSNSPATPPVVPPTIVKPATVLPANAYAQNLGKQQPDWVHHENWPQITPHVEQVTEKIAARLSDFAGELRPRFGEYASVEPTVTDHQTIQPPALSEDRAAAELDQFTQNSGDSSDEAPPSINRAHWPRPYTLDSRLDSLSQYVAQLNWTAAVDEHLEALSRLPVGDRRSAAILVALRDVAGKTNDYTRQASPKIARDLLAARTELLRRVDLWQVVDLTVSNANDSKAAVSSEPTVAAVDSDMQHLIAGAEELIARSPQGASWRDYLMLSSIGDLARRNGEQAALDRRRVAQQVLRRLHSPQLTGDQQTLVASPPLAGLARGLRAWVAEPIDVAGLLHAVEEYEVDRLPSSARPIAEQIERLQWSLDPAEQRLGEHLVKQYRNANLRLVVTAELLNRVLPQPAPQSDVVNDRVLGVPTYGHSLTSTKLNVRLIPDAKRFVFGIEAVGVVDSQTTSTSGPVTFVSQGESTYSVCKIVNVSPQGLRVTAAEAHADSASRLAGMNTEFDSIPLVRALVRNYALSQHEQMQPSVQREVESKVAGRACQRFDGELDARLAKAEKDYRARLLSRLDTLALGPTIMSMQTNDQRMTGRLRLAGSRQLGSHTPRPLAMSDSLASVQLHETVLNNALEQLQLAGRTFTLPELHRWIATRLGRHDAVLPADLPEHVTVTFAEYDPISVRCDDGRIQLTIAIAELDQGKRVWNDFEVTTYYRPQIEGLTLQLVRDGSIELGGEAQQGRVDVILRGIFAKILARERRMSVTPLPADQPGYRDLAFAEPTIENGWLSLAITPKKNSKANVATKPGAVR